jgi:indole-3-glycerol phosphate synthase
MSASRPSVLEGILQSTREELQRRKRELPQQMLEDRLRNGLARGQRHDQRSLQRALSKPGMAVIAEFKRRSPSAGELRAQADVREIVSAYSRGGADALSVLTEGPGFGGSLEDLRAARGACDLPILRKDFIVDPYQLHEALLAGADAVLLIVAALRSKELTLLHEKARELGLEVLVEVHDSEELQSALGAGASLIGVNNRDLRDFSVDVGRTAMLMAEMPAGVTIVSESGIVDAEQLRTLEHEGVDAVLVGGSLMRAADPELALRALRGDDLAPQESADHPAERI